MQMGYLISKRDEGQTGIVVKDTAQSVQRQEKTIRGPKCGMGERWTRDAFVRDRVCGCDKMGHGAFGID